MSDNQTSRNCDHELSLLPKFSSTSSAGQRTFNKVSVALSSVDFKVCLHNVACDRGLGLLHKVKLQCLISKEVW
jgi:hypothetical protein